MTCSEIGQCGGRLVFAVFFNSSRSDAHSVTTHQSPPTDSIEITNAGSADSADYVGLQAIKTYTVVIGSGSCVLPYGILR